MPLDRFLMGLDILYERNCTMVLFGLFDLF